MLRSDMANNMGDEVTEIFDAGEARHILDNLGDGIETFKMTSLGCMIIVNRATAKSDHYSGSDTEEDDDHILDRLSLAYERLYTIPKILLQELAPRIKILDVSYNEFDNLLFLKAFPNLTTFICDRNNITDNTIIPYCPKLELLWMNHCQIVTLYPWARRLQQACPNLKFLSLMGNPAAPSYLNGGNFYEYLQYRYFLISIFYHLIHLDDRPVTVEQKQEACRMYQRPLVERLVTKTQTVLPEYLRRFSESIFELMTPPPAFAATKRNVIV